MHDLAIPRWGQAVSPSARDQPPGVIAIFLNSLRAGGAERAMVNLAGGLIARGYPVVIVLASGEGPLRELLVPGIEVVELSTERVAAAVGPLVRWLRAARPRVLLSACVNSNAVAVLAARLAGGGVRTVVCEQTTLSRLARDTRRLRHLIALPAARWAYPQADAVVSVSGGVADDLETAVGLTRSEVHVIPNPLSPDIARRAAAAPEHPWLSDGGPPVFLAVGRLTPAKDLPTLLRAFVTLRTARRARLVVLGEGEERARLQGLVDHLGMSADVDLAGFSANPYPAMAAAAALVLSSRREGLPTVLMEALSLGTPVVSTDCASGPREILQDGRLGRLVPAGDHDALAAAMDAVLVEARSVPVSDVLSQYALDTVTDRYLQVLEPERQAPSGSAASCSQNSANVTA